MAKAKGKAKRGGKAKAAEPRYKNGALLCNGTSKRTGKPCRANAMAGREKCYHHGGKSLKGAESPSFKHGAYSKDLPARLAKRYEQAATSPELASLRADIALLETRTAELLEQLDAGGSAALWAEVRSAFGSLTKAIRAKDGEATITALEALEALIERGARDGEVWEEIRDNIDTRRKAVDTERKRLVDLHQMITVERAVGLMFTIAESINRNVTDPKERGAVAADIGRLVEGHYGVRGGRVIDV